MESYNPLDAYYPNYPAGYTNRDYLYEPIKKREEELIQYAAQPEFRERQIYDMPYKEVHEAMPRYRRSQFLYGPYISPYLIQQAQLATTCAFPSKGGCLTPSRRSEDCVYRRYQETGDLGFSIDNCGAPPTASPNCMRWPYFD